MAEPEHQDRGLFGLFDKKKEEEGKHEGVLFFPLSLLSRKGAMHDHNQKNLAPSLPHKVKLPLSLSS